MNEFSLMADLETVKALETIVETKRFIIENQTDKEVKELTQQHEEGEPKIVITMDMFKNKEEFIKHGMHYNLNIPIWVSDFDYL